MRVQEFLSILSTQRSGLSIKRFFELGKTIDIYDFKKNPEILFGEDTDKLSSLNKDWFDSVVNEFEVLKKRKIHHLYPGHPNYPNSFFSLKSPPLFLSAIGDLTCLTKDKISVVGSRYPSSRVLDWMDIHLKPIVQSNVVLVSGAARGIDQRAHLVAISNESPTIAFLPSGIGCMYPSNFEKWKDKILSYKGLILSEYGYHQPINGHHFHERNRMIAKLGLFVLVCEARRKSGSTMTARIAIENSKTVCVLPGFPSEKNAQGCLDLLFQGAIPVRDADDLKVLIEAERLSCRDLFIPNQTESIDSRY